MCDPLTLQVFSRVRGDALRRLSRARLGSERAALRRGARALPRRRADQRLRLAHLPRVPDLPQPRDGAERDRLQVVPRLCARDDLPQHDGGARLLPPAPRHLALRRPHRLRGRRAARVAARIAAAAASTPGTTSPGRATRPASRRRRSSPSGTARTPSSRASCTGAAGRRSSETRGSCPRTRWRSAPPSCALNATQDLSAPLARAARVCKFLLVPYSTVLVWMFKAADCGSCQCALGSRSRRRRCGSEASSRYLKSSTPPSRSRSGTVHMAVYSGTQNYYGYPVVKIKTDLDCIHS